MVLPDADEVEADLIGQLPLPRHCGGLRLRERLALGIDRHVSERI